MSDWIIDDKRGNSYTVDGISLADGEPQFRVGNTTDLVFIYETSDADYRSIRDEFSAFLTENTVFTGTTFRGVPFFQENIHPSAPIESYLWKLTPDNALTQEAWWIVPVSIEDNSLYDGAGQRLAVSAFVIAPAIEGNRTYIEDEYKEVFN